MASPNFTVALNDGTYADVVLSADGIFDVNGNKFNAIPSDATIEPGSGNIVQNGNSIGRISPITLAKHTQDSDTSSPLSIASGIYSIPSGASAATTTAASAAAAAATAPIPTGTPVSGSSTSVFAGTRNLDDGGARLTSPGDSPNPSSPTNPGTGPGTDGKDPNADGAIKPEDLTKNSGPGNNNTNNNDDNTTDDGTGEKPMHDRIGEGNPQHEKAPDGTYDFLKDLDKAPTDHAKVAGIMSKVTSGLAIAGIAAKALSSKLPEGLVKAIGKVSGIGGVVMGGWGVFSAMSSMFGPDGKFHSSASGWINLGISSLGVMMGMSMLMHSGDMFAFSAATLGWGALIIGGAMFTAWALNHWGPKKDAKVSPVGGLHGNTNMVAPEAPGWTDSLPAQSIYMIVSAATSLSIGLNFNPIDLNTSNTGIQQEIIAPSQIPTLIPDLKNTLQIATNTTIKQKLDEGPIFIKKGEGDDPDKVVYVTQFTSEGHDGCGDPDHPCNAVNTVSLNGGGALVSENAPSDTDMMIPFYASAQNGRIMPNPDAFNAVGQQSALAKAAFGTRPASAANAVNMAAMMGKKTYRAPASGNAPTPTTTTPSSTSGNRETN
jgi:hypothetical protein